ncbi:hypothetical protein AB0M46_16980 [Dactylosporangium sp. NPDC051485]|uniref:hypothetical protein n=1 Tax=Dactylosporangium sp. NPDC051485 TaxID=3154846 RepID=UPI0034410BEE
MTGAPVTAAAPAPRRGGFLVGVTLVAMLVSLVSVAVSVYALGVANDAKDAAGSAQQAAPAANNQPNTANNGNQGGNNQPTAAPTTARPAATTTAPRPVTSPGELDPKADFTESWSPSTINLEIHPPNYGSRNIDLDKPEVGSSGDAADMQLYVSNGEFFTFDRGAKVVTMNSANVQPSDCAAKFDTSRLAPDTQINVKTADLTLCINTSFEAAQHQGIKWKIVLLHVTGVAADGTVNVSLKAWNVPD